MSRTGTARFEMFMQSLHDIQPFCDSPRGYDEAFSSSSSDSEKELVEASETIPSVRRIVTDFDDDLVFYAIHVPETAYLTTPKASLIGNTDLKLIQSTQMWQDATEVREDTPSFSEVLSPPRDATVKQSVEEGQCTRLDTVCNLALSEPLLVTDFPDAYSEQSQDDRPLEQVSVSPPKLTQNSALPTVKRPTLKRTYLESQTLDSLVTSVNLTQDAFEFERKRPRYDFSDRSFACLFGTVTDPTSGEQKTEQQIFPKTLWPSAQSNQSCSDHTLTSLPSGDVRIVVIPYQATFEIASQGEHLFATVLKCSKDAVEVRIDNRSNRVSQLDSFKLPPFTKASIVNHSVRLRAQVQLVASRC